jgi:peroxidase
MNRTSWNFKLSRTHHNQPRSRVRPMIEQLESRHLLSVTGFSPITEIGNNVANPNLGIADTQLLRQSPAAYKPVANGGDGLNTPSMTYGAPTFVAGPRLVSNIVDNQAAVLFGDPSTDINTVDQNGMSDFGYVFGQFMDHDMDLTPTQSQAAPVTNPNKDGVGGFPIPADPNQPTDPLGVLPFTRSVFDPTTGITTPRQQTNAVTSYLDLSNVYGSNQTVSDALRTFSGGLLKSSPGNLLPYDSTAYFTTAQIAALNMANDSHAVTTDQLFAAGDVRANENVELTALQTLFMRNHNQIAAQLHAQHPGWNDEQLFQEARKLNIAEYQNIVYTQYLPDLLGPTAMPAYTGYNPSIDPSIANEFSTVAFRFGHSMLNNNVARDNNDGSAIGSQTLQLAQDFFNPNLINPNGVIDPLTGLVSTDIDALLKGDADGQSQAVDVMAVSDIRNLLFGNGPPGAPVGDDLMARDIWRADDNGIGTYNQLRVAYGLPPITDDATHGFDQISSDPHVQQLLTQAYTGPTRDTFLQNGKIAGDINPFIAGLAEDHLPGSDLGPLFTKMLVDQFTRLETGDRFFYLNETFNNAEKAILKQGTMLGDIISANTGVTNLQNDVFINPALNQQDALKKGFFTTHAGQEALTGSTTGNTLITSIYNTLVSELSNPNLPGYLILVDAYGNFEPDSFLQSYSNVKNYLRNASPDNMAYALSAQLLTTEFNISLGLVDPTISIFVPAVTIAGQPMSNALQNSLINNGVSNSGGVANIQTILNASIAELASDPYTTSESLDRRFEKALRDCLEAININENISITP